MLWEGYQSSRCHISRHNILTHKCHLSVTVAVVVVVVVVVVGAVAVVVVVDDDVGKVALEAELDTSKEAGDDTPF